MLSQNIQSSFIKSFRSNYPTRTWCINQSISDESYWTLPLCLAEAKKYRTRDEWERSSPISYQKAINRGWLIKCTAHIVGFKRRSTVPVIWTLERCIEMAKQCQKRAEFKERFHYPYEKARKNGWLDICCAHMGKVV